MDLIKKAFCKAYDLHYSQRRKISGAPYLVHVLDAAKYLMYETDDEEIICAGLLHDTLEDTNYSEEELLNDFGGRVFRLVYFCTEPSNTVDSSVDDQRKSWRERKSHAILKLEFASDEECLVFCADKISNLLSMKEDLVKGYDIWNNFNASKKDIFWYYSEIEKILSQKIGDRKIFKVYKDLMGLFSVLVV